MFKQVLILLVLLLSFGLVFADMGPSPSYTFSISNSSDYPNYTFYYSGNIWPDKLSLVTDSTHVYKFNTLIRVFAIKSSLIEQYGVISRDVNVFDSNLGKELIISNEIGLGGGHTVLEVSSFDDATKKMVVSVKSFEPDSSYPLKVLFFDPIGWILILVIVCILIGGFAVIKTIRKKSK